MNENVPDVWLEYMSLVMRYPDITKKTSTPTNPPGRVVQFSSCCPVAHRVKRVQGIDVEFPADVDGAVGPHDVDGEGSEPGEVDGFGSDAAVIFEEGDIADVVASILDAPMASDGGGGIHR